MNNSRFFVVFFLQLIYCYCEIPNNSTDLVDLLTNSILKPLILSQEEYESPEELFVIDSFKIQESEDYSLEGSYEDSTSDSSLETTDITATNTIESSTNSPDTNEILEITSNYHGLRVKIANLTHTVLKQQDIIFQHKKMLRDLENIVKKRKTASDKKLNELKLKNEKCRTDFNSAFQELSVAKKIISMQKYSKGLKQKLKEFKIWPM